MLLSQRLLLPVVRVILVRALFGCWYQKGWYCTVSSFAESRCFRCTRRTFWWSLAFGHQCDLREIDSQAFFPANYLHEPLEDCKDMFKTLYETETLESSKLNLNPKDQILKHPWIQLQALSGNEVMGQETEAWMEELLEATNDRCLSSRVRLVALRHFCFGICKC